MGRESRFMGTEKFIHFVQKSAGKETSGRPMHRWEDIKTNLKQI